MFSLFSKNVGEIEKLDFDKFFQVQMIVMKINQCHPDTKINKYWFLKVLIIFAPYTLYFVLLINSMQYYIRHGDYFSAFRNSVPIIFYICMLMDFYLLIKHRPTIGNLIKCMKNDYVKSCTLDNERKAILYGYAVKGINIMNLWCFLMVGSLIVFMMKSIALTLYESVKAGERKLIPFHEMNYPLNITEIRETDLRIFVATFFGESYFTSVSVLIYFSTVPLGPIFMLHACGQMELIKMRFDKIFENENVDEQLKIIVQDLQYIYRFVDEINVCFTLVYEILLKQTMILLPLTSYAITMSISYGEFTAEYVAVFMESLFTSSIPCYYGDLLIEKGEEVRLIAYSCGWENVHLPTARRTLLIIMTRAFQPVAIKSIFCTICLDTLTNVYRQAYTIFNLMSAMWN